MQWAAGCAEMKGVKGTMTEGGTGREEQRQCWGPELEEGVEELPGRERLFLAPLSYNSLPKANPGPSARHLETAVSRTETHGV